MAIKITSVNFKLIKTLLENKSIKKSLFANNKLLDALLECNSIYISGKPQQVYLNDEKAFFGVLNAKGYSISKIEDIDFFIEKDKQAISRDEVADKYAHTKSIESKSFNGLMISTFNKLEVNLNEKRQYLHPAEGMGSFIHYTSKLELGNDVILVGVENPQVVWYIDNYKHLFDENKKYLFLSISEYKTNYQYKWLESFKGEYIHFGDFDLAGISIYLNTVIPRLKNCNKYSFLIPDNIYNIIKEKNYTKDYQNQIRFLNIKSKEDKKVQKLIDFIKSYKITLEQETLSLESL